MMQASAEQLINATWAWGRTLPGFKRSQALHAVKLVAAFGGGVQDADGKWVAGLGADTAALQLAALDLACILWIDDLFDTAPVAGAAPLTWEALMLALDGGTALPELHSLADLAARFRAAAAQPDDYRQWRESLLQVLRASHEDQRAARGERSWTWTAYLQNGEHNIAVAHMVYSLSLAYRLGLAAQADDPAFGRALQALCVSERLRNDLASADKERIEGNRSNGLFVLERELTMEQARAFVNDERLRFEGMLEDELKGLRAGHPFARIARVMSAAVECFYGGANSRYGAQAAAQDSLRA
ncbi:MAG TPA: hypothetical protein VIT22_03800 [Pseudoxanthomonas sp.]